MSDELAKRTPAEVAAFYKRLADKVDASKGSLAMSLAAVLMHRWLAAKKELFSFDAPPHLTGHASVLDVLRYHRAVYLTEKKASFTGGATSWAGIIPRLQGKPPHQKWDGVGSRNLEYQSLVELPLRYQVTGSDADRDLLYALHGFQLKTNVIVTVAAIPNSSRKRVTFTQFQARALDRYDWDYTEHLTVPNPDFNSKDPAAIAPQSNNVVVYHSNAKRLEDAGLAAPYDLETKPWAVTDQTIAGPGEIDPNKSI